MNPSITTLSSVPLVEITNPDNFVSLDAICKLISAKDPLTRKFITEALTCSKLFDNKQQDYGPSNIGKFGYHGVIVRMSDKLERLINLYKKESEPNNESIEDTLRDLANYAIIGLLCRKGEWPK